MVHGASVAPCKLALPSALTLYRTSLNRDVIKPLPIAADRRVFFIRGEVAVAWITGPTRSISFYLPVNILQRYPFTNDPVVYSVPFG